MHNNQIKDLRSALNFLEAKPGELETYSEPVAADCEAASIYASTAGGVPVRAPTSVGPAILFDRVMPADRKAVVGMFGSRQRCDRLLLEKDQEANRRCAEAQQSAHR